MHQAQVLRQPRRRNARGFTIIELLVTVAIIMVLVGILVPVLSRQRAAARIGVCQQYLHNAGAGLISYATDHDDSLPFYDQPNTSHLWQWSFDLRGAMEVYGNDRARSFCPESVLLDDSEKHYAGDNKGTPDPTDDDLPATGYTWLVARKGGLGAVAFTDGSKPIVKLSQPSKTPKELVVDTVVSNAGNYRTVPGAFPDPMGSSHLRGPKPAGSNAVYTDGHVTFHTFDELQLRLTGPDQWW